MIPGIYELLDYTDNDIPNFEVESSYIDLDGFRKMGSCAERP